MGIGRLGLVTSDVDPGPRSRPDVHAPDPADPSPDPVVGRRSAVLVWTLIATVTAAAIALYLLRVDRLPAPVDVTGQPWLMLGLLVLGFAAAELAVVYLPVGRNAYSISLNELPLVVGLFLVSPTHLVIARLVGALAPLAWRNRRSLRKLAFNLSQYALEAGTVVAVYQLAAGGAPPLGPRTWLAVGLAVLTSDLLGSILLTLVIAADTGERPHVQRDLLSVGQVAPLVNASFALVLVYVVTVDWRALWTVGVVVAVLVFAQRSQNRLRRRTESLEQLSQFTGEVGGQLDVDSAARTALVWMTRSLKAEVAELVLHEEFAGAHRRWVANYNGSVGEVTGDGKAAALGPWLAAGSLLVRRGTKDRAVGGAIRSTGLRDAVAMPLQGDGQVIGTLLVGDRLGDVETFASSDLRELIAVGNHLSVTLRNARRADVIREQTEDELRRSLLDELTGLPNRRCLEERVVEHLADGGQATAILLDLDRFKDINDTLGYRTGDALLQMVAERLDRSVPSDALVARLSGNEYAVLLLSDDEATTASVVALIRHAFARPYQLDELQVTVEASLGVASTADGSAAHDLLRRSDIAMFAAKSRRTGVETYRPELEVRSPASLTLLTELRDAITGGELIVHFQPKIRLSDGEVMGAEALVRWIHPERGFIQPDDFIPVAEHSGLITPLTFAVMRQSLDACAGWRRAGRPLGIAINISPRSLLDASFVDEIARALAAVEVPSSAVTLEITESSLMADPERAIEALHRLRSLGVRLSIDDLGTGYSSLSYLQRLPVSEVKIDRSFLTPGQDEADGADSFAIVGAIVDLGHRLGRDVVAEGVEDEDTWNRLQQLGCDTAQGYWMSRPLAADAFNAWLEEWAPRRVAPLRALR